MDPVGYIFYVYLSCFGGLTAFPTVFFSASVLGPQRLSWVRKDRDCLICLDFNECPCNLLIPTYNNMSVSWALRFSSIAHPWSNCMLMLVGWSVRGFSQIIVAWTHVVSICFTWWRQVGLYRGSYSYSLKHDLEISLWWPIIPCTTDLYDIRRSTSLCYFIRRTALRSLLAAGTPVALVLPGTESWGPKIHQVFYFNC